MLLRGGRKELGGPEAIVTSEVGGDGYRSPTFQVVRQLLEPVGRAREELPNAEEGVERAARGIHLKETRNYNQVPTAEMKANPRYAIRPEKRPQGNRCRTD